MADLLKAVSKRAFTLSGILCFCIILNLVLAAREEPLSALGGNDFIANFYVAGDMVNHGLTADLYPPPFATTFSNSKYQQYAQNLFHPQQPILYTYAYPPVVALAVAPLAKLPANLALKIWRALTLLSLLGAAMLFCRVPKVTEHLLNVFFCSFLFFPLLAVIVAGQTSMLIGLLPLAAGYYFWQRQRPLLCGLCWSVLSLKPQVMIPVILIAAALLLSSFLKTREGTSVDRREPLLMLLAMGLGTLSLQGAGLLAAGFQLLPGWLNAVKITNDMFGQAASGYWQYHLYISLPCTLMMALSGYSDHIKHLAALVASAVMFLAAMFLLVNLTRLNVPPDKRRDLLLLTGLVSTLAVAPHFLLYDAGLFLLGGWIIFYRWKQEAQPLRRARMAAVIVACAFDAYVVSLTFPGWQFTLERPLVLLGAVAGCTWLLLSEAMCSQSD